MTQAYIAGFRKAAEAYGVDPNVILKIAQSSYLNRQIGPTRDAAEDNAFLQLMNSPALQQKMQKIRNRSNWLERYLGGAGHYGLKEKMYDKDFNSLMKAVAPAQKATVPNVPGPGPAPKAPIHIAKPKIPAVKLPEPK